MTTYFLDTNICVYILNRKYPYLTKRYLKCESDVNISTIVLYELYYGAEKSQRRGQNIAKIQTFVSEIRVVPFDKQAAEIAGKIRSDLERKGQVIGGNDIIIAATALTKGATLVTNNTKEFKRVDGLILENWIGKE